VHHNLGVARLPELMQPWMPHIVVDPRAMDAAAADFRRAIELSPSHVASYEGLAGLIRGMATFEAGDMEVLARGLTQSPGNTMIEAGMAAAEVRAGRVADGRARLARLCARHPTAAGAGMSFARRLLEDETFQAELDEINQLSAEHRIDEVILIVERALARRLDPAAKGVMENVRRRMRDYQTIRNAVDLANTGNPAAAQQMLESLLATEPDPATTKEAQRIVREITKQEDRPGVDP
jgi:predicted Zn-dependent protease